MLTFEELRIFLYFVLALVSVKFLFKKVVWSLWLTITVVAMWSYQGSEFSSFNNGTWLVIVLLPLQFFLMKRATELSIAVLGMVLPVFVLVAFKTSSSLNLIGVSYLCFRLVYLVFEVYNERVPAPNFTRYLSFLLFPMTFAVGPINPYENFVKSKEANDSKVYFSKNIFIRIIVGLTKNQFLAAVALSTRVSLYPASGILEFGLPDVFIYCSLFYLHLYLIFSGFSDVCIGLSRILGIKVKENFKNPLFAPNIKEFWNRWHLSLTDIVKELVFYPLSIFVKRKFRRNSDSFLPLIFLVLFVVIGFWHGVGFNFFFLGVYHAFGMSVHHYFSTSFKKKWPNYQSNQVVRFVSTPITFAFVSFSFVFFDDVLRWL